MRIVFGRQLTFGFDDRDHRAGMAIIACVDRHSSTREDMTLAELVSAAHRPVDISRDQAIGLVADLIREDAIRLVDSQTPVDKVAALALMEKPERWPQTLVVRAPVVDDAALQAARQAAEAIFGRPAPRTQNKLCRWLRLQLRDWIGRIESFQRLANTTDYPGKADMADIVAVAEALLAVHAPDRFIGRINGQADRLKRLGFRFDAIRRFYDDHGHVWQALSTVMTAVDANADELADHPASRETFSRLKRLYHSPRPFTAGRSVLDDIALVRSVHKKITREKTLQAVRAAQPEIDAMITELRQALDRAAADSAVRNQALYPLQHLRRRLDACKTPGAVNELLATARDAFDTGLNLIEAPV